MGTGLHGFLTSHIAARFVVLAQSSKPYRASTEHEGSLYWHRGARFFVLAQRSMVFWVGREQHFLCIHRATCCFDLSQSSSAFCPGTQQQGFLCWHRAAGHFVRSQSSIIFFCGGSVAQQATSIRSAQRKCAGQPTAGAERGLSPLISVMESLPLLLLQDCAILVVCRGERRYALHGN